MPVLAIPGQLTFNIAPRASCLSWSWLLPGSRFSQCFSSNSRFLSACAAKRMEPIVFQQNRVSATRRLLLAEQRRARASGLDPALGAGRPCQQPAWQVNWTHPTGGFTVASSIGGDTCSHLLCWCPPAPASLRFCAPNPLCLSHQ